MAAPINLTIEQVTNVVASGTYQLVDPSPDFLTPTIINIDLTLSSGAIVFQLPLSTDYIYGKSQEIIFQTSGVPDSGVYPTITIKPYVYSPVPLGVIYDRLNSVENASVVLDSSAGDWYIVQLVAPTRWLGNLI